MATAVSSIETDTDVQALVCKKPCLLEQLSHTTQLFLAPQFVTYIILYVTG